MLTHPARERLLIEIKRQPPLLWKRALEARLLFEKDIKSYEYISQDAFLNVVSELCSDRQAEYLNNADRVHFSAYMDTLLTMTSWRMTQGIYRIDPDIYCDLISTPFSGDIPVDVLLRMPEWCIFVDADYYQYTHSQEDRIIQIAGFWARIAFKDGIPNLVVGPCLKDEFGANFFAHGQLPLKGTIKEAVASLEERVIEKVEIDLVVTFFGKMLNVLLYICSQNADITGKHGAPCNPQPVKTKHGLKLFPPTEPRVWDVGVRMGAALRAAYAKADSEAIGTHAAPRPHIRRAHWHGFRSGPKVDSEGVVIPTEKRKFELRWLPPIPVAMTDELLPSVIRPVQ